MTKVFVPSDTTARSLGSDQVAAAIAANPENIELVRTGSRGLYWLEPLVEIETAAGRIGFPNVTLEAIERLFARGIPTIDHEQCLGLIEEHSWLQHERLTCARLGIIEPLSLDDYLAHEGFVGLD